MSARLAAVAHLVEPGNRVADVGTDHGYPIYTWCRPGSQTELSQ